MLHLGKVWEFPKELKNINANLQWFWSHFVGTLYYNNADNEPVMQHNAPTPAFHGNRFKPTPLPRFDNSQNNLQRRSHSGSVPNIPQMIEPQVDYHYKTR